MKLIILKHINIFIFLFLLGCSNQKSQNRIFSYFFNNNDEKINGNEENIPSSSIFNQLNNYFRSTYNNYFNTSNHDPFDENLGSEYEYSDDQEPLKSISSKPKINIKAKINFDELIKRDKNCLNQEAKILVSSYIRQNFLNLLIPTELINEINKYYFNYKLYIHSFTSLGLTPIDQLQKFLQKDLNEKYYPRDKFYPKGRGIAFKMFNEDFKNNDNYFPLAIILDSDQINKNALYTNWYLDLSITIKKLIDLILEENQIPITNIWIRSNKSERFVLFKKCNKIYFINVGYSNMSVNFLSNQIALISADSIKKLYSSKKALDENVLNKNRLFEIKLLKHEDWASEQYHDKLAICYPEKDFQLIPQAILINFNRLKVGLIHEKQFEALIKLSIKYCLPIKVYYPDGKIYKANIDILKNLFGYDIVKCKGELTKIYSSEDVSKFLEWYK